VGPDIDFALIILGRQQIDEKENNSNSFKQKHEYYFSKKTINDSFLKMHQSYGRNKEEGGILTEIDLKQHSKEETRCGLWHHVHSGSLYPSFAYSFIGRRCTRDYVAL
jgi:hypothetical protein